MKVKFYAIIKKMITQNVLYSKTQYIFFHFTNMNKFYFTRRHFTVQTEIFSKLDTFQGSKTFLICNSKVTVILFNRLNILL